jgi:hypothetical protein
MNKSLASSGFKPEVCSLPGIPNKQPKPARKKGAAKALIPQKVDAGLYDMDTQYHVSTREGGVSSSGGHPGFTPLARRWDATE